MNRDIWSCIYIGPSTFKRAMKTKNVKNRMHRCLYFVLFRVFVDWENIIYSINWQNDDGGGDDDNDHDDISSCVENK